MAQTYTADTYDSTHVVATDMANIEDNFAALRSSFSGTSAPSGAVGGQLWHDSTARKVRNYANSAWLVSLLGDATQKMWIYRNDTCEGWLVDSSITDVAIVLKGGTGSYNVNGGNLAGSWTVSGLSMSHTHSHTHQWYDGGTTGDDAKTYNSAGTAIAVPQQDKAGIGIEYAAIPGKLLSEDSVSNEALGDAYTTANAAAASTTAVASTAAWRPRAAVGTLQYPDLS